MNAISFFYWNSFIESEIKSNGIEIELNFKTISLNADIFVQFFLLKDNISGWGIPAKKSSLCDVKFSLEPFEEINKAFAF